MSAATSLRRVISGASIGNAIARLTATTGNPRASAFNVIAAEAISFVAVLTLSESAGRPLPAAATTEVAAP